MRQAPGARRRGALGHRRERGVRHRRALFGAVPRERARPHHRLQRRLPHLVGLRHRAWSSGPVFEDNLKAVERRPLHRSAPGPRRVLLQPQGRRRGRPRSSTSRRRRCACSASSRRRTWMAGPSRASHEGHASDTPRRHARARLAGGRLHLAPGGRPARHRARLRRPRLRSHPADDRERPPARHGPAGAPRAVSRRSARPSLHKARWPGPPSSPASTPAATASSTSSIAIPRRCMPYLSTTTTEPRRAHPRPRPLAAAAVERPRRVAAARQAVLGGARGARCAHDDHPHAGELPAIGHGHPRAERHGHARPDGHLRHLLVLHLRTVCLRRPPALWRHRARPSRCATAWCGRRSKGPTTHSSTKPQKVRAEFTAELDQRQPARADRVGRRAAAAGGGRVERLGAGELSARAHAVAAGRGALLPEGPRSVLRALCQPGQHRSAAAGHAGVASRRLRRGTGRGHRALLHAGHAGRHQGAQGRRAHR